VLDAEADDDHDAEFGELESDGRAHATAGVLATVAPTPSANANAPMRPMYFALSIVVPPARHSPCDGDLSAIRRHRGPRGAGADE
jgi:hypothetical protein